MKKAKLFMMLALLVMGVSNTWADSWNDGVFEYNTQYTQSTNNVINLGTEDGIQCVAIRLYLNPQKTKTVKDTVYYEQATSDANYEYIDYKNAGLVLEDYDSGDDSRHYYYKRTRSISYPGTANNVINVTIPATVTRKVNGKDVTYKVTAIQKFGFNYEQTKWMGIYDCDNTVNENGNQKPSNYKYWPVVSRSNRELLSVDFTGATNLKYIGDYAFMGCDKLSSITLPSTLVYLGTGAFEMCDHLTYCDFVDNRSSFTTLKSWTFWMCRGLKNLQLPDCIVTIAGPPSGKTSGAPLQYLTKLTDIRLPNSLTTVGAHFLCCAGSLTRLVIPNSVTKIDAACFHGCQSLREVTLLGPASALKLGTGESKTFGENCTFDKDNVHDCTFYTTPDWVKDYASDSETAWYMIADNVDSQGYLIDPETKERIKDQNNKDIKVPTHTTNGNKLIALAEVKRTFEAGRWVTAIFPETFKHTFAGQTTPTTGYEVFDDPNAGTDITKKCRVAKMTAAEATSGVDPITNKPIILYKLTFTLVNESDFKPDVPYMFCPGRKVEDYVMISKDMYKTQAFKQKMTQDFKNEETITADDGAVIEMLGHYDKWDLYDYCFYFSYNGNEAANAKAKFYRVPENSKIKSDATRCFWYVKVNGIKTRINGAKVASNRFFDDEENNSTNGIEEVETRVVIDGIYDLNGRKLDIKPEDLPKGLFIINGKKVMINK